MLDMLDVAIGFVTVMLILSLIIMSLTQAIVSLLALRGAKLRQGLETLIKNAAPTLSDHANDLATRIVKHPLISDSAVFTHNRWSWASAIKREEFIQVLKAVLQETHLGHKERNLPEHAWEALDDWFDPYMTRVSQWFVMNTRWITLALAIVIGFGFHVDSVQLLKQIQEDSVTRAKLSAMSTALLDQTPEATRQVDGLYVESLKQVVASRGSQFKENTRTDDLRMTSRPQAAAWIRENAKSPADADGLIGALNADLDGKLTTTLNSSIDRAKTLEAKLASAGIVIYPPSDRDPLHWAAVTSSHFWGMIATVLFLSLGAPFWFNVLKNMTSLRSVVAEKKPELEKEVATVTPERGRKERPKLAPLPAGHAATV